MISAASQGVPAYAGTNQNSYVSLTKTASQTSISAPTPIAYTYTIKNIGSANLYWLLNISPYNASGSRASLTDNVCSAASGGVWSGGTTYNFSGSPAYSGVVAPTGFQQNSYGDIYLSAGASATLTCTQTISATTTNTATLSQLRNVNGFDRASNLATTATVTYTPPAVPDLAVTKTTSATTVNVGDPVGFTIGVSNSGSASGSFTVTDTVPNAFTIASAPGCSVSGQTVTCTNTGLAQNGSTSYVINTTANAGGAYTNQATANLSGETNTSNNTGQVSVTIKQADLTVTKTVSPNPVVAGQPVAFTITVNNTGNAASSTYTLNDAVPAQFTNVQFSGTPPAGCSITGNTVTCANQPGLPATTGKATYTLTATASTAGDYTNTATLSATSFEDTSNNSGSVTGSIQSAQADLTVTKTANPTTGLIKGNTVTYTVTVKNSGNTTSSTYTLSDPIPAQFTSVAVTNVSPASTACTVTGNTVSCPTQAGLAPGATRAYTITAVVNDATGGTFTNTATISNTTGENTANNTGSVDVIVSPSAPDLAVTKTASSGTVVTGGQVTYTVTVQNVGNQPSGLYTLTDVVPNGFTQVTQPATGCTLDAPSRTVTCANQASLAAGASATFTITATAGTTPMSTTNTASVAPVAGEVVTTNNSGSAAVDIVATSPFDLVVTKGASQSSVNIGSAVVFTIVVANNGTGASPNYTLQDVVPSQFSGVSFPVGTTPQPGCAITGNTLNCTSQAGLAPGERRTYLISAVPNVAGTFTNSATATTTGETNTDNNTGSTTVTVRDPNAALVGTATSSPGGAFTLTKTANPTSFATSSGGSATYTYTVKNNTNQPIYLSSAVDDKCSISNSNSTGTTMYNIYGPAGIFVRATWRGIAPNATATWTCTQTITQSTTNTATFQFATGYSYDFWGTPSMTGTQTATVQARVTVPYDPWAACSVNTIWGNSGSWGGTAYIYEYTINADGSVTPTGRSITAANSATGSDIAVSPDNKEMYVLNGAGTIRVYDVATGALLRTLTPNYGITWSNTSGDNTNKANSLSFGPNGNLYVGGFNYLPIGGSNNLFSVNPTTGAVTTVWTGGAQGSGVVPYGYAGDFVTLPDGSLLAAVNVDSGGGRTKFVIFPKLANGTLGAPVDVGYPTYNGTQMSLVYGMTYAQGYLWLANNDGNWYRISTLPTLSGTASTTYAATQVTEPNVSSFWGATGSQEANTSCTSPSVAITKDAVSVTGPNASGVYTANYTITVKNTGTATGTYAPITDMPQFDPVFTPTGATWTVGAGTPTPATTSQTGVGPYNITTVGNYINAGATHTYNVSVTFTWSKTALPGPCVGPGTGLFNSVQANPNIYDDSCITPDLPWLNVVKTGGTITGPDASGVYSVSYTVKVVNSGSGATTYGPLTDQPQFDPNLTVQGASWTGQTTGSAAGTGPYTLAPANTAIAGNTTHTYNLTVRYKVTGTGTVSTCQATTPNKALFNSASLPNENGPVADNTACVDLPIFAVNKAADAPPPGGPIPGATGPNLTAVYNTTTNSFDATVKYFVTVTNTGTIAGPAPAVTDTVTLPVPFVITQVTLGGVAQTLPAGTTQTLTFTIPPGTAPLQPGATVVYTVIVSGTGNPTQSQWSSQAQGCNTNGAGTPGNGFFNAVTMAGDSDGPNNNDACVNVYEPTKVIHLAKYGSPCDVGVPTCPISGAQFALYTVNPATTPGSTPAVGTSITADPGTGSLYTSSNLHYGWDYWLVETTAANGYELLADPIKFKITGNGIVLQAEPGVVNTNVISVVGDGFTISITDPKAGDLPKAGGPGHAPNLVIGLLLVAGAALIYRRTSGSRSRPKQVT